MLKISIVINYEWFDSPTKRIVLLYGSETWATIQSHVHRVEELQVTTAVFAKYSVVQRVHEI